MTNTHDEQWAKHYKQQSLFYREFVDKIEFHLMKSDQPDLFILKELIKLEETLTYINNRMVHKCASEKCEESLQEN